MTTAPPRESASVRVRMTIPCTIKPLGQRVLVECDDIPEITKGGIHLPDRVREREKPTEGRVLALGPGDRDRRGARVPFDVEVGQRVLFGKYAGQKVEQHGEAYLMLEASELIGIVAPA